MNWFTRMRQKQGIKSMQILSWSVWSAWFFLILIYLRRIFFWNIGETGLEIQTEVQEKAGPRWALLGLGRTHGSAGPRLAPLALPFLCVARLGVVCCVRSCCSPTLVFCLRSYSKTHGNKTKLCQFENRGVDLLLNYQIWGHITFEGKYLKINAGK